VSGGDERGGPIGSREPVAAVVVSFQPGPEVQDNIAALAAQAARVLVVDNGSGERYAPTLDRLSSLPGVEVIPLGANHGIAAALNRGVRQARAEGYPWVATFDQDSRITAGYMDALFHAYAADPDRDRIALLAPVYVDEVTGEVTRYARPSAGGGISADAVATLTSGNLLRGAVVDRVGPFDEGLFIDFVDIEFCLRCSARGLRVVEVEGARLFHNLGRQSRHRLGRRSLSTSNHDATRRYYMARNRVHVYRRYARSHPGWVGRDLSFFVKEVVKVAMFEDDAVRKLRSTARGLLDGIRGRVGMRANA
jgi:rhamnosyltransferase